MPQPNIKRNLEAGQIFIGLWINGIHVNRSPLFTPLSAMGNTIISRFDTLWGGSNMELSMQNTLVRRPGYSKWCTSVFGVSEWPLQFYSYQNLSGTITTLVDTQTNTYSFTPSAKTNIVTKLAGAVQTAFQRIGQALYMASGKSFQATGDTGTIGTPRPVGLAVPQVAPSFTVGSNGFLLPTTGFTFGYSYGNSTSGHVSTMSPLSPNVGDLNVQTVTEGSVTVQITLVTATGVGDGPGTVVFSTPNGNNFHVGQTIKVTGFPATTAGTFVINNNYVITAQASGSFSASTAVWGPPYHGTSGQGFGQNCYFVQPTINCYGTLAPITIPASPYVYTVVNTSNFAPTNGFGAATPSPVSVKSPGGTTVYTQIASGTPTTGQFVVNATTGAFTFAAADTGKPIVIKYAVTPTTGSTPVSFVLSGPASNNQFSTPPNGTNGVGSNGNQTDLTGYANADFVVVYRDQDTDLAAGPWFFLAQIPNNLAITQATVLAQSNQVIYTLANSCPAGANNGFAGATNSLGATIAGFVNAGNNGNFDIVASTATTITCVNSGGVNETHAATVNSGTWTYTDTGAVYGYSFNFAVPDGELDILIQAPIADSNNPPPNTTNPLTTSVDGTFSLLAYGAGRMWGAVDNFVYFAGGPDVTYGNGNESWPSANVFVFPGKVTALASVPAGIIVFTADDMYIIYGTSTSTFYPQVYQKNFGVASQNSLVLDGDTLYIYSNSGQLWSFTNSLNEVGLNVAPYLAATFTPPSVYLTMHKSGADVGLFISDGSTNYLRYRIDEGAWSPLCQIVGGASCFQSIESAVGVYTLMVGKASGSGFIASRDLTTWTDIGGTFTCNAIVGSFIVAPPGATALVDSIQLQYANIGADPTISFLAQDYASISGSVASFSALMLVNDPPKLIPSGTAQFKQKRAYLKSVQTPIAQEMSNLQVNISFPSENFKNEILTLGVS